MSGVEGMGIASSRPPAPRNLTEKEFRRFRELFQSKIGLHLAPAKKLLLSGRLGKRLDALGLSTFSAYLEWISDGGDPEELQTAIDLVTTHETFFFREAHHFVLLRDRILPGHPGGRPLRVWSAACSTGEEPYSVAMVLQDALGAVGWELVATDIARATLAKAAAGLYRMDRIDGIPPAFLKSYCLKGRGEYDGMMLVAKELRSRVDFRQANLTDLPGNLGKFDVVLLRNVIIYFDAATKRKVLDGVVSRLVPGGWLLLGHSESLAGFDLPLEIHAPSVYRRLP